MNRLIIEKPCTISLKNSTLLIDDTKVPLRAIDALYLSYKVDIDLRSISRIAKAEIPILILTTRPKEFIHIQKRHYKNAHLKEAQYRALDKRVDLAKIILTKKINSAVKTLKKLHIDFHGSLFLKDIDTASNIQELLGIEGNLAKSYFKLYFAVFPKILAKGSRTKHPPKDPVNALLSYLYTIFYYEIVTKLIYYGLDPSIGYLHKPFRDHLALASDLLEPLRGNIDLFAAQLLLKKQITPNHFTAKRGGVYLSDKGRKELWTYLKEFLDLSEPKIKKEISWLKTTIEKNSISLPTLR